MPSCSVGGMKRCLSPLKDSASSVTSNIFVVALLNFIMIFQDYVQFYLEIIFILD